MNKIAEIVEREVAHAIGPEPPPCNDPSATLMAKAINDAWEAALRQACLAVARAVVEECAQFVPHRFHVWGGQTERWDEPCADPAQCIVHKGRCALRTLALAAPSAGKEQR